MVCFADRLGLVLPFDDLPRTGMAVLRRDRYTKTHSWIETAGRRFAAAAVLVALLAAAPASAAEPNPAPAASTPSGDLPDLSLWSGARALNDIATQLSFGPRALGSHGHERAVQFISEELKKAKVSVELQRWSYQSDAKVSYALTNVIGRFDASNPRRVIIGTHYDSIVRAYRDKVHPEAPMPGANNSASGVALLLETLRALYASPSRPGVGVDLVFFDGEEGPHSLGEGDPNWFPLGSPYFAAHLSELYPKAKPESAVIFDMVCDRDLKLVAEPFSLRSAGNDVRLFWTIGRKISPWSFVNEVAPAQISDDQVALDGVGIPSFLVIDFDYEPWFNTTQDTVDKCSQGSLETVGRTLFGYLYQK